MKPIQPMASTVKRNVGRPPKFREPRRPVTVTLPERTLAQLAGLDSDRARAIVTATDRMCGEPVANREPVSFVEVTPGQSVILIDACPALRKIPWLRVVPIGDGRALIAVQTGTSIEKLEVALTDLLDSLPEGESKDRLLLERLGKALRTMRRVKGVTKAEILFLATGAG